MLNKASGWYIIEVGVKLTPASKAQSDLDMRMKSYVLRSFGTFSSNIKVIRQAIMIQELINEGIGVKV